MYSLLPGTLFWRFIPHVENEYVTFLCIPDLTFYFGERNRHNGLPGEIMIVDFSLNLIKKITKI